jgi:hypothetical protein
LARAATDRSETPRDGRVRTRPTERGSPCGCGGGVLKRRLELRVRGGILAAAALCPVGRPGTSLRSCVASLSEPVERVAHARRHPEEG